VTQERDLSLSMLRGGVDFLANLIIMDSKGIEIILGMDWLKKYDRVILCAKSAVRLTTEFSAVMTSDQASMLNQVLGNSLEEIWVVQEHPDVFPKELPGMPPHRDIEFIIDLLPGTPPISKGPYRMPINELVELKKQIAELQSKGFICPSSSPWEHPSCSWKRKMEHNGCAWIINP
jgi:hypothetical protein